MCPDVSLQSLSLHHFVASESSKADLAPKMNWVVTLSEYSTHPTPVQEMGQPGSPLVYFRRFLIVRKQGKATAAAAVLGGLATSRHFLRYALLTCSVSVAERNLSVLPIVCERVTV